MITVTVRYGMTRRLDIELEEPVQVIDITGNPNYRATLGFPENVAAVINGVTVSSDHYVNDGDIVTLEVQASRKA
jgi:hypothetical protein